MNNALFFRTLVWRVAAKKRQEKEIIPISQFDSTDCVTEWIRPVWMPDRNQAIAFKVNRTGLAMMKMKKSAEELKANTHMNF